MKFILFFLLLNSCFASFIYYPSIPKQYISDKKNGIAYTCQNTVGPDSLWIRCEFHNESLSQSRLCIDMAEQARDGFSGWALNSRTVCSGKLEPNQTFVNYTAFEGDDYKRAIELCGHQLERCWLASLSLHPL